MLTFFHLKVAAYKREEAYLRGWGGGLNRGFTVF